MPKYKMELTFEIDDDLIGRKRELNSFVKDALESCGGQFSPDDWLFSSLENVVVKKTERIKE